MDDPADKVETNIDVPGKRRVVLRICLATVVLFCAGLIVLAYTGFQYHAPEWLAKRVEQRLNTEAAPASLRIGGIDVTIERGLRPTINMHNVGVFDEAGLEIGQLNQVQAALSPSKLLLGGVSMRQISLSGAQVTLRRKKDGAFDLSFGSAASTQGNLGNVLNTLETALSVAPLTELNGLNAFDLTITLEDARTNRFWQVTGGQIAIRKNSDGLDATLSAEIFNGTEELAKAVIGFSTSNENSRAHLTATFENAAAADIAAQSPALAFLTVLDSSISGALRAEFDANGEVAGFAGSLNVSEGAVQPTADTPPIPFQGGQAYVEYDPETQAIEFSEVAVTAEAGTVRARGQALLQEFQDGWPSALVGQFALSDIAFKPKKVFANPIQFESGSVDMRLRLDPLTVDIGQFTLVQDDRRFRGAGQISAVENVWNVGLDLFLNAISVPHALEIWPIEAAPGARRWVSERVLAGSLFDISAAFRSVTGERPKISAGFSFNDANVLVMPTLPPVTDGAGYANFAGTEFTVVVEQGVIVAPIGDEVDVKGSVFKIPDVTASPGDAEVSVVARSALTPLLSVLDLKPFQLMSRAGLPVDIANGDATARASIRFQLLRDLKFKDVAFDVAGAIGRVNSTRLMEGFTVTSDELTVVADNTGISIAGDGKIDGLPVNATWQQAFGQKQSRLDGSIEISRKFLDVFEIGLPEGAVTGRGIGQVSVAFEKGEPPQFRLNSDINRVAMRLDALDWSKPQNSVGKLEVVGQLGKTPSIDRLMLDAAGLLASGVVDLTPSGALKAAQFDRVRVGDWLDGPVTLSGRGNNASPAVEILGGTVDLRAATLGGGSSESGPITLSLDRLKVTDSIELTEFTGAFKEGVGLSGQFQGKINGAAPIRGTVVPTPNGGAIEIVSNDAGRALAASGILENGRGGEVRLNLNPRRGGSGYDGRLIAQGMRIFEAPALTELLSAISIVGLLEQVNTGGILLNDIDGAFTLTADRMTLYQLSAVGPSLGISLDGVYDMRNNRLDMQGVVSPVYFLNAVGSIFSRGKEGLFGFQFNLVGDAENPDVRVNPLSILTPGMFREIFRRPPPKLVPSQ